MKSKFEYPKINLAVDNCFASKRWTNPSDWAEIITNSGIRCVEISADCECDPLYCDSSYLQDWLSAVKHECKEKKMRVTSVYSGHGTYSTIGLAHGDERIRTHLIENWLVPYSHMAHELNAGIGFYIHAFSDDILQSCEKYYAAYITLADTIIRVREASIAAGAKFTAVEQMYSPQQIPWTISGAERFMRDTGTFITIDTGHQTGQRVFQRPSEDEIYAAVRTGNSVYTGTVNASEMFNSACERYRSGENVGALISEICADIELHNYLFASPRDCDLYAWLKEVGVYSPIIHLQQTDGSVSAHRSFTPDENIGGVVKPQQVLSAIKESFESETKDGMPPKCSEITLTLELFYPLTDTVSEIKRKLKVSAEYWRAFVPHDGMRLDELV